MMWILLGMLAINLMVARGRLVEARAKGRLVRSDFEYAIKGLCLGWIEVCGLILLFGIGGAIVLLVDLLKGTRGAFPSIAKLGRSYRLAPRLGKFSEAARGDLEELTATDYWIQLPKSLLSATILKLAIWIAERIVESVRAIRRR